MVLKTKPIQGFESYYSATDSGDIFSHPRPGKGGHKGKLLKPWKIGHGYFVVSLYYGTRQAQKFLIHRLVAQTFIPNPRSLPEVNHKNGIITDNRQRILEWCTSKQNKAHGMA
jgi:hypothetical protein